MSDIIQSLWWGPMTNLERLSAASYIKNGHPYHLYTYATFGGIPNPPEGVVVKDAEDILPISEVAPFTYLANFADRRDRLGSAYSMGGCRRPIDDVQCSLQAASRFASGSLDV